MYFDSALLSCFQPICRFQGQAADAEIAKKEIKIMKSRMVLSYFLLPIAVGVYLGLVLEFLGPIP